MDNESRLFKTGFFLSTVALAKGDYQPLLVADQQRISSYPIIPK